MRLWFLGWLCLIFFAGTGMAADIPYVFSGSSSNISSYTANQLENASASSPELAGVPPISTPSDNEVLAFPNSRESPANKTYLTVAEIKRAFNTKALHDEGIILLNMGRYDEALDAFSQAVMTDPNYAEGWNCKGKVLHQMRKFSEAIKSYNIAIALKPSFAEAWNNKAKTLYAMGKYREAISACEKAIRLNPMYAMAWYNKAKILRTEADEAFMKAGELGLSSFPEKSHNYF